MNRTYQKNILRTLASSRGRFLSIFSIVALGVGFLAGLVSSTPNMRLSVETYLDSADFYDLRVLGTLGLTDDDVQALAAVEGVESVRPAYSADLLVDTREADSVVARVHSLPEGGDGAQGACVNRLQLTEGRWPQSSGECVVEAGAGDLARGGVAVLRVQWGTPAQNVPPPSLPGHRPQQLTEGCPQGIEICSGIRLSESELLRRRIAPGPKQAGILRLIRLRFSGGVKINQPDMSVRRQQNVVRLDIPVENAMAVEELQHLTQLQKGAGQRPLGKRDCRQTGAFYILLCHTGLSLALFHRQDLRQIGVVQRL